MKCIFKPPEYLWQNEIYLQLYFSTRKFLFRQNAARNLLGERKSRRQIVDKMFVQSYGFLSFIAAIRIGSELERSGNK